MKVRRCFVSNSSTSSFLIIGTRTKWESLYTKTTERDCECDVEGIDKMTFCPSCGKRVMVEVNTPISDFDEDDEKFGRFQVKRLYDEKEMIIGFPETFNRDGSDGITYSKIPDNIAEMKSVLEPLGLWNEEDFGIWHGVIST